MGFAPHTSLRAGITLAQHGKGGQNTEEGADKSATPRQVAMSWAQRLKQVFGIELNRCSGCGGKLEVIASIEEPEVIARILAHREKTAPDQPQSALPLGARAPPTQAWLI